MAIQLVCVHPFKGYKKGQIVTDELEIARLRKDREHHFVAVVAPEPAEAPPPETEPQP